MSLLTPSLVIVLLGVIADKRLECKEICISMIMYVHEYIRVCVFVFISDVCMVCLGIWCWP